MSSGLSYLCSIHPFHSSLPLRVLKLSIDITFIDSFKGGSLCEEWCALFTTIVWQRSTFDRLQWWFWEFWRWKIFIILGQGVSGYQRL
jgi:hypothetical protein